MLSSKFLARCRAWERYKLRRESNSAVVSARMAASGRESTEMAFLSWSASDLRLAYSTMKILA